MIEIDTGVLHAIVTDAGCIFGERNIGGLPHPFVFHHPASPDYCKQYEYMADFICAELRRLRRADDADVVAAYTQTEANGFRICDACQKSFDIEAAGGVDAIGLPLCESCYGAMKEEADPGLSEPDGTAPEIPDNSKPDGDYKEIRRCQ